MAPQRISTWGHKGPVLTDLSIREPASRHTTAPINTSGRHSCEVIYYLLAVPLRVGGRVDVSIL